MEDTILRRTWAEIDLDALEHNYNVARQNIGPGVKYLGVVKADAYGHGAVQVARKLEQLGADYLAVSSLDEGRELRHGGITMPILILGHTPPEMVSQLIEYNITQAVSAKAKAEAYSAEAVKCGGTLRVHIKVDTGMSRLGFLVRGEHFETGVEAIAESCALPGLDPEGIFTHFAVSDMDGADYEAYTREQFGVFTHVLDALAAKGRTFTLAVRFSASPNTIADSLVIDTPHFVIDGDGTELGEGNQFVRPVNLPGYWNLRTTLSYGFPVRWLRSNLNVRAGVTTGRIPSVNNGTRNRLNGDSYDAGLTLGSNISESVDFKIGYTGYYNVSRNSSQIRTVDNVYVSQYLTADLNFVVRQRIVLRGSFAVRLSVLYA